MPHASHRSPAARSRGPTRGFFDVWSRVYDFPLVQLATYRPVHDAVLAALAAEPHARVLDVGCGTGQLAERVVAADARARVVGCDFSAGMLAHAMARAAAAGDVPSRQARTVRRAPVPSRRASSGQLAPTPSRLAFVRGDAMRLPFRDAVFDAVVSTEAFHWFPDQNRALGEFHRVLAPGGRLLLALVTPPLALIADAFHLGSRLVGQPLWWSTAPRLRARVEAAGLRVERQRRIFRIPGFLLLPMLIIARRPR